MGMGKKQTRVCIKMIEGVTGITYEAACFLKEGEKSALFRTALARAGKTVVRRAIDWLNISTNLALLLEELPTKFRYLLSAYPLAQVRAGRGEKIFRCLIRRKGGDWEKGVFLSSYKCGRNALILRRSE
jgi:hypothetical protein